MVGESQRGDRDTTRSAPGWQESSRGPKYGQNYGNHFPRSQDYDQAKLIRGEDREYWK